MNCTESDVDIYVAKVRSFAHDDLSVALLKFSFNVVVGDIVI